MEFKWQHSSFSLPGFSQVLIETPTPLYSLQQISFSRPIPPLRSPFGKYLVLAISLFGIFRRRSNDKSPPYISWLLSVLDWPFKSLQYWSLSPSYLTKIPSSNIYSAFRSVMEQNDDAYCLVDSHLCLQEAGLIILLCIKRYLHYFTNKSLEANIIRAKQPVNLPNCSYHYCP